MNCSRRMNASSMFWRRLVARIATPVVLLHPLQQVGDLDVGVAVVGVAHLGALAEQRVGLVEEQDGVGVGRPRVKMRSRFFSVSPMYLLTTADEVDRVQVEAELAGDDLGGHRLAGAGRAGEERGACRALRELAGEAPVGQHAFAQRQPGRRARAAGRASRSGQHEVVPAVQRLDPAAPGGRAPDRPACEPPPPAPRSSDQRFPRDQRPPPCCAPSRVRPLPLPRSGPSAGGSGWRSGRGRGDRPGRSRGPRAQVSRRMRYP